MPIFAVALIVRLQLLYLVLTVYLICQHVAVKVYPGRLCEACFFGSGGLVVGHAHVGNVIAFSCTAAPLVDKVHQHGRRSAPGAETKKCGCFFFTNPIEKQKTNEGRAAWGCGNVNLAVGPCRRPRFCWGCGCVNLAVGPCRRPRFCSA